MTNKREEPTESKNSFRSDLVNSKEHRNPMPNMATDKRMLET